jgi:hypothetical protein
MPPDSNSHHPIETVSQLWLVEPRIPLSPKEQEIVETHKPMIAEALHDLRRALKRLGAELEHAPFAVVFEPIVERIDDRPIVTGYRRLEHGPSLNAAITAYCTIDLEEDDPVNKPVRCHGVVGIKEQRLIDMAVEVNRLKSVLKDRFAPLTDRRITINKKKNNTDIVTKIPVGQFILRQLEQASLNRLGAYRNIPLIRTWGKKPHPPTPLAVRFTESWSQSVVRRTVSQLIHEAEQRGRTAVVDILERSGIPENEYLYSPKEHYLRMRANLTFPGATPEAKSPKNYMGELPILFKLDRKLSPPTVDGPKARQSDAPRQRASRPLAENPIINSPPFYRRANPSDREVRSPKKTAAAKS